MQKILFLTKRGLHLSVFAALYERNLPTVWQGIKLTVPTGVLPAPSPGRSVLQYHVSHITIHSLTRLNDPDSQVRFERYCHVWTVSV